MKLPLPGDKMSIDKAFLVGENEKKGLYHINLAISEENLKDPIHLQQKKYDRIFLWTLLTVVVLCITGIFLSIGFAIYSHLYRSEAILLQAQVAAEKQIHIDNQTVEVIVNTTNISNHVDETSTDYEEFLLTKNQTIDPSQDEIFHIYEWSDTRRDNIDESDNPSTLISQLLTLVNTMRNNLIRIPQSFLNDFRHF